MPSLFNPLTGSLELQRNVGNMASTLYVDPINGDNANAGTFDAPKENLAGALSAISDAAVDKPYEIFIFPGETNDLGTVTLKKFVSIRGSGKDVSYVSALLSFTSVLDDVTDIEISDLKADGIEFYGEENTDCNLILRNVETSSLTFSPTLIGTIAGNVYCYNCVLSDIDFQAPEESLVQGSIVTGVVQLQSASRVRFVSCVLRTIAGGANFYLNDDTVLDVVNCGPSNTGNGNYGITPQASFGTDPIIRYDSISAPASSAIANTNPLVKEDLSWKVSTLSLIHI